MNKKELESLIYSYHWRKREVNRLERILYGSSVIERSVGVSRYGIEATLPKGSPLKSHAELEQLDLRDQLLLKRYNKHIDKVLLVERIAEWLEDEIHQIIIDCMMEGMSYRSIAAHLGVNREKIRELKEEMLCHICQNCHFLHELKNEKSTC